MTEQNITEQIRKAAAGDASAFALLVEAHYMMIYRVAYKWAGRREDAEDISQNVCMKLPEKLASFRGEADFTSWLYRLTINAAQDYRRTTGKAHRREQPFADDFDPASSEVSADRRLSARQAMAAIHQLPADLRDAVLLVYAEDKNHKEAAMILGCAETTISWRIFQARKKLRAAGVYDAG